MRIKGLAGKIELAVTVILFAAMLLNCGRYINIKINGRSSAFSGMPENDKRVLFRTVANDSIENVHDLVDPLFIGFKSGDITVAAAFDRQSRSALKTSAFEYIVGLFSGKSEKKEFADEIEKGTMPSNLNPRCGSCIKTAVQKTYDTIIKLEEKLKNEERVSKED